MNDGLVDGSPKKCPAPGRVGGRNSHPPVGRVTVSWAADGANVSGETKNSFRQGFPDALRKSKEMVSDLVDGRLTVVMRCLR